ncbi:MAG: hemerythrin family protein [Campylobacterota bacterium]|nr:hemerythrin family protein [Campylobacterota bacterium]
MGMIYAEQLEYMSVDSMQEMHESEIKILNEIDNLAIDYERDKTKASEIEAKLAEYAVHVKEHFSSEEKLMLEYDYPSYEMHKMAHDMFLEDFERSMGLWKRSGRLDKIIFFIRKTPEWLYMHVNSVDAGTSAYLAKKMHEK